MRYAAVLMLLTGCHVAVPDGAHCTQKGDCKSDRCTSGYCDGSGCSCPGNTDCTSGDCNQGWLCKYYPPDAVTGFFGNQGSHHCVPLCGVCPPDYTCPSPGQAAECTYVPPVLTVDAYGPYSGRVGQPVTFHASAASPVAPITTYTWMFGDGTMGSGASVTHVYQTAYWGQVNLLVADQAGDSIGTAATVQICGFAGASCATNPGQCCSGTTCNTATLFCQ